MDGLLNPGGPTERTINRVLAAPAPSPAALSGLTGEAVSANARLVRHLMTTTEDGLVPTLLADDFRSGAAARAKSVDLFAQLFLRDPARARDLRDKAGAEMSADEAGLLDRLILAARRAEAERPRPGDADEPDDPDGPGDPDNPPGDPGKPDKPKPDQRPCQDIIDALQELHKELEAVRQELRDKQADLDENEARIKELEAESKRLEAQLSVLLIAQRLAARSGSTAIRSRTLAKMAEIREKLAQIQEVLESLKEENAGLKSDIESLAEQERQKRENAVELERRLKECEGSRGRA